MLWMQRVLKENSIETLGQAIARNNRQEKAKAKLDEMVDNYLKPFMSKEEEKSEAEPVVQKPK